MGAGIYAGVIKDFFFFFGIKDVNQVKEQISVSEIKALQQNKNFYVIYITVLVFLNIWKFSYIATFKRGRNIWCFSLLLSEIACYTWCNLWIKKIKPCFYAGIDVKSFWAPFCSFPTSPAGHSKDTKGLNLLCDIGFPLGSHKQRIQRPWISLF